ncbi:MAG TPA: c-type cytochrome [Candidatus Binataceae bacterium]|nr:c-type cytochrome [Candidatus Binataceae bacterium]
MRFSTALAIFLSLLCGVTLFSTPTLAQDKTEMSPTGQLTSGKRDFMEYCAQCHGKDGIGDGPVASTLSKKPANLTLLSRSNGGTFPQKEVREYIDGGKYEAAHGTRDMPIWGYAFMYRQSSHNGPGGAPLTENEVHHKITRLIDYIKTIQVK